MSPVTKNILIVLVALLGFGAFVVLAEGVGGDSDAQDRLDALQANTTTTFFEEPETTTTTFFVATTTTLPVTVTTSAPATTPTTKKATTATTKKPTTATTVRTTTTVASGVPVPHNGPGTEASDNKVTFSLPAGGGQQDHSVSNTNNPFFFDLKTTAGAPTGNPATSLLQFEITLRNNTSRTITFPGSGLTIGIVITRPGATDITFTLPSSDTTIGPGTTFVVKSSAAITATPGDYTVTASIPVDYGS